MNYGKSLLAGSALIGLGLVVGLAWHCKDDNKCPCTGGAGGVAGVGGVAGIGGNTGGTSGTGGDTGGAGGTMPGAALGIRYKGCAIDEDCLDSTLTAAGLDKDCLSGKCVNGSCLAFLRGTGECSAKGAKTACRLGANGQTPSEAVCKKIASPLSCDWAACGTIPP
jgi:hypothetical protein